MPSEETICTTLTGRQHRAGSAWGHSTRVVLQRNLVYLVCRIALVLVIWEGTSAVVPTGAPISKAPAARAHTTLSRHASANGRVGVEGRVFWGLPRLIYCV